MIKLLLQSILVPFPYFHIEMFSAAAETGKGESEEVVEILHKSFK